jgi:hypothetical protein
MTAHEGLAGDNQVWPLILLIVGLVLCGGSFVWPLVAGAESGWSVEDAKQYQEASSGVHRLTHMQENPRFQALSGEGIAHQLDEARTDFESRGEQLQQARDRPQRVATGVRYAGFALMALGAVIHVIRRRQ